jgi:hypothetical protein
MLRFAARWSSRELGSVLVVGAALFAALELARITLFAPPPPVEVVVFGESVTPLIRLVSGLALSWVVVAALELAQRHRSVGTAARAISTGLLACVLGVPPLIALYGFTADAFLKSIVFACAILSASLCLFGLRKRLT